MGEKTRLLSLVDILEPLSRGELERFARRVPTLHLSLGQLLHTPSHSGELFFLLLEGRIRIYRAVAGREFTVGVADAGAISGEGALTMQHVKGVYARAAEPATVAIVGRDQLRRLIAEHPEVGMRVVEVLSERLSRYGERMADLGYKEVRARLAGLLEQLLQSEGVVGREGYRIPTPYTHAELATMIGAGRVAVTRALGELRETGAVQTDGRQLHIIDPEALQRQTR